MKTRWLRWVAMGLLGVPLVLLVLVNLPPVTRLVVRKLLPTINKQLNGQLAAESVSGSLLGRLTLHGVTLRDPEGEVVVQAERVELDYGLWDLLHGRISLGPIVLERPVIRLLKDHPGEPYSIVRVFAQEESGKPGGSVDLRISDVEVRGGTVYATVWRQPGDPQRETVQTLDTVQVESVNLHLPAITYVAGPAAPRTARLEIGSAQGRLVEPELVLRELTGEVNLRGDSLDIALTTVQLPRSRFSANAWLITGTPREPRSGRYAATAQVTQLVAGDIAGLISGATIPPEWTLRGDVRASSRVAGAVLIASPNLEILAAGGSLRGRVTVVGADNEWRADDSRLNVAGVEVQRLLRAFNVRSNLRATLNGVVTANGRSGSADLRVAGLGGYGVRGAVNGYVRAKGSFDEMVLDTRLTGGLGDVTLTGRVATGKHLRLDNLRGTLQRLNLAAVDARLPESGINARFEGDVQFGSMPRTGNLRLYVDSSIVRGIQIDTAMTVIHADGGLLTADSLVVRAPGLQVAGSGTFGLYEDQTGDLTLSIDAPSLAALEPLVAALTGDSVGGIDGAVQVHVNAKGSLAHYTLGLEARGSDIAVKGLEIDSLHATAAGVPDSLVWSAAVALDDETAALAAGRRLGSTLALDSLTIERRKAVWRLDDGAVIEFQKGQLRLSNASLRRAEDPGVLSVSGTYPGDLTVTAERVPLADLLNAGKHDSLPDLDAKATLTGGNWSGNLALVFGDKRPLTAEFATNPLRGRLQADSFDLALVAPLMPTLRNLGGRLDGGVAVAGTKEQPRLDGQLQIIGGTASVPATGVRYTKIDATLTFAGDALTMQHFEIAAGRGRATLAGNVRFARLDRPELDLTLDAERFPLMNRRDFLEATATGKLNLKGTTAGATLTGQARVDRGTAYLDRFLRSAGIDLSDSLYAQFVDTTLLKHASLGPGVIAAFVDSLQIRQVEVDLGDSFWLRSPDASIQLAGRVSVNSAAPSPSSPSGYNLVGTVRTVRGTYRMALAPGVTREFMVREGSIRYFGDPKTEAELNIEVDHQLRTALGDRITITAQITGTMVKPAIQLTSDVTPKLSETELISYLLFGAPTVQAFLGREGGNSERRSVFEQSAGRLVGVLSGKIESAIQDQLGLPIDYFRIKPGEVQSGLAGTELVLGMQVRILGFPSYLRASPRFCPREQLLSLDHIGIDLETRIAPHWGVATSVDPVQGCEAVMAGVAAKPYQLGVDLFWEKR